MSQWQCGPSERSLAVGGVHAQVLLNIRSSGPEDMGCWARQDAIDYSLRGKYADAEQQC